jgi:electron transfer flavoprotein beta subunit
VNVVVLAKWVPEPQGTPSLGPDHLLVREGADGALDPGDEIGLEAALQLVERDGGEITVVSMGPEIASAACSCLGDGCASGRPGDRRCAAWRRRTGHRARSPPRWGAWSIPTW